MHHAGTPAAVYHPVYRKPAHTQMSEPQPISSHKVTAIETPQSVVVAGSTPAHLPALLALLEAASPQAGPMRAENPELISQDRIGPLAALPDWLAEHPQAHLLILVSLPALVIARGLSAGTAPSQAVAEWLESAEAAMRVVRLQRRRVSLFFAEPALANPKAFLAALGQRLQLTLDNEQGDRWAPEMPGTVLHMMAENAILQSAEARNLASEMHATALPVPVAPEMLLPSVEQAFDEYCKGIDSLAEAQQKAKIHEEVSKENELLLTQLHQVQEGLEEAFLGTKKQEEQLAETARKVSRLEKELAAAREQPAKDDCRIQELEEENELLLLQLHQVQEELERYFLESTQFGLGSKQPGNQESHSAGELDAAQKTIRAIYDSYSWKLTRPLRWFQRILTGADKPADIQSNLPGTLDDAKKTIQALYNSKSWKVTAPLRKVGLIFKGESQQSAKKKG